MKFYLALLFIFAILVAGAESRRVRHHSRHHSRHRHRGGFTTNLYQLALGMATELMGGINIDACLPAAWKNAGQDQENDANTTVASDQTTWQKILGYLGTAVDIVCAVKDYVGKAIAFITGNIRRLMRRYIRLFLQGKVRRTFSQWWGSDLWDSATSAVSAVWSGVKTAYGWVTDKLAGLANAIIDAITGAVVNIYKAFEAVKAKFLQFWNSPLMVAIRQFIDCVSGLKEAIQNVKDLIKGFKDKAVLVTQGVSGWVQIIVGLICAWKDLKTAVTYLINGIQATGPRRWNWLGKFVGKLVYTIATSG